MPERRKTRQVRVGNVLVGGNAPIAVQSMTTTKTSDLEKTLHQLRRMQEAGCEIGRVAVFDEEDADCLAALVKSIDLPIVADIHFRKNFALKAIEANVAKVRLNPGNIGGYERAKEVILAAKNKGIPIRIGVNSGSVEKDLLEKYGYPSAEAMVESALRHVEWCEGLGFKDIVVSLKATDLPTMLENYRMFSKQSDIPLHLGVTEAGQPGYGTIKSAIGIGTLLLEGIGDTIRVSLTGDPVDEVIAAYDILKATGARVREPELIACPMCGRIAIDLEKIVAEVKEKTKDIRAPLKISLLGCAVNGPGEAREADIGLAGGNGEGLIFKKGKIWKKVKESELVDELVKEVRKMAEEWEATQVK